MKQERVILSFIMVLIGLLVAGTAFYFYQGSKTPAKIQSSIVAPTPIATQKEKNDVSLTIKTPKDESVTDNKNLNVSGNTNPNATVLVITDSDQDIVKPNAQGDFKSTITLANDQNLITVISILPNGDSKRLTETITYSTSNF